ncbi:type VII secretion protein EccB [Rhodococcus sp. 05-2255-3B1]|nr:type VII secretion protein EccB [Rhodococcus sp. 05-339-2]OZE03797.1 type VII secretion protein EccB [Rhodococcus sp. 05-2255-3B1]OZE10587.1 type VII secretion protein EccB [Rhodococcus sp. 05-2255-3C]OZE12038.1 type VII secretion protein EccB [Rhodococcus sp. 05-2255-2A2]
MASTPTTKWQVGGYRFLVRRMEHALIRRDARMLHDPMRSQTRALLVGVVIACIGLAGCAALALFRPQDKIGDASIVVGKDSGAMFVKVDDVFHPVLNLASARLIVGKPDDPSTVQESELSSRPRGALVGIPGAPSALPHDGDGNAQSWTVCDTVDPIAGVTSTTVLVGDPRYGDSTAALAESEAFLWTSNGTAYLVHDGTRSPVDLNNRAVVRALGLEDATPSPVSTGLLNSVPESPPIAAPFVPRAGEAPAFPFDGRTIGSVVKVAGRDVQYYVVLEDGIQAIDETAALLIKFTDSQGSPDIAAVNPDLLADAPTTSSGLEVSTFPATTPEIVDTGERPVGCLTWEPLAVADGGPSARLVESAGRGLPLETGALPVALAQADGGGDAVDQVYLAPGSGGFVRSTGISTSSTRQGSVFFVADTGVRYGVDGPEAASALGFGPPAPAPWQILQLLGSGPTLGRGQALTMHDGVGPDPRAAALPTK